jgi:hypothetical protein
MAMKLLINAITITVDSVIIPLLFVLTNRIATIADNNMTNTMLINARGLKDFFVGSTAF